MSIPGGWKAKDLPYYTGASQTWDDGDKLVHGQQGEVVGPATGSHEGKGVAVLFPGNKGIIDCYLDTVRRLRAASTAAPLVCAPQAPCVPVTASAAAPQPSLHEQSFAPQPTARVREGGWPRGGAAWPLRWQRQRVRRPSPNSLLLTAVGCVRR